MKKLLQGILDFRKNVRPGYRDTFAKLALGQAPDALFIACSDSRVVPNLFASTNPGDLFVIRNVGNLVPKCSPQCDHSLTDESEAAAIEFALQNLKVSDVIVCGHSECGAMQALLAGRQKLSLPNLRSWLRHAETSLERLGAPSSVGTKLAPHNRLSQLNVLVQMEHLMSYPMLADAIQAGKLRLHGWWFDLAQATVHCWMPEKGCFVELDEEAAAAELSRLT